MSPEALQKYIVDLREWMEKHGKASLPHGHSILLDEWTQELASAEGMLEKKPELPIAFLGPSQQGKSSLINALLGENVLAVGGSIGACTCVITSIHHSLDKSFRAEIDFISLEDWRRELRDIQTALNKKPDEDDTEEDQKEWQAEQASAIEKYKSVYREDPQNDFTAILQNKNLNLPSDIVESMEKKEPIKITEENALTLRNKVRRYLVGREQHQDGQYWPLISRVRIYGGFPVLANGVVLVDLPGLNDPNPAREQVTKNYLSEARFLWLVCNSQTGIDRVFTQLLRDNALLYQLFMEGRLDAFSVVTTRIDEINLEAVLEQMGSNSEEYDGNHGKVLAFRRAEIKKHVSQNLTEIAQDIAARAENPVGSQEFFNSVSKIPVFPISTSAYLHSVKRMPLYQGMKMQEEETWLPKLISHLNTITQEQSYEAQIKASHHRLSLLYEKIRNFFLNQVNSSKQQSAQIQKELKVLFAASEKAVNEGLTKLSHLKTQGNTRLRENCENFYQKLEEIQSRAQTSLTSVCQSWASINWRTLQAAVKRKGEWYSIAGQREYNFSRDVARSYLDLLPFLWDEFFSSRLSSLVMEIANNANHELQVVAKRIQGAMDMIRHVASGSRESLETNLRTAEETFQLQAGQVTAELRAHIQRTRQSLSSGMVETAAEFMAPAYQNAAADPGGAGIKNRILEVLSLHAGKHAPSLFISMRKELSEGVDILVSSLKPQITKLIEYGENILKRFAENMGNIQPPTAQERDLMIDALERLPKLS